jgi:hypothetical protein
MVKILDMGLVRVTAGEDLGEVMGSLTHAGVFLGTPDYIAPEQAEDPHQADIRSDLYGLGGTMYFLLVGELPYPGANVMQKLRRLLSGPLPSVAARRPDVPHELDAVVKKLMDRNPAARFQTPAELIDALDVVLRQGARNTAPAAAQPPVRIDVRPAPTAAPTGMPAPPELANRIPAHPGGVQALSLSADGKLLLSGGQDETLRLWGTARLQETRCITGDVGPVQDVCLAPGAKWAASCALRLFRSDMVVHIWDLTTDSERRRLKGHTDNLCCVTIAPDGRRVAAGSADHTVRLWNLDVPGGPALWLKGHTDEVRSIAFVGGGDSLLSGSYDGQVRLWDTATGALKGSLNGQVGKIEAVAFNAASKRMAIAGRGLRVRQANGSLTPLHGHRGPVLCVSFSPDGQFILSGGSDGTVRLWRAADGEELHCYNVHTNKVHAVAYSPVGRSAYSGSADGTICGWPLPT